MKNTIIFVIVAFVLASFGVFVVSKDSASPVTNTQKDVEKKMQGGTLPTNIVLDMSGQGLTSVPMSVFSQTKIEELNLSNNALTGALQSQVGALKNLKVLNLSNNNFTGVPAEIGQLTTLEVLDLSNNKLTGLPNELGNLRNLKLLDVSGNQYSKVDLDGIKKNLPSSTVIKTE